MKIAVHAPFGSGCEEIGVVAILAKYLKRIYPDITQLRCSGSFSACDRDSDTQWRRGISNCFRCMQDQQEISRWSEVGLSDLSSFISADEIRESREWITQAATDELPSIKFAGVHAFPLIIGSFHNRFGAEEPNLTNHHHEQVVRRQILSAVRASLGMRRFLKEYRPTLVIAARGENFISQSLFTQASALGVSVASVKWDLSSRVVHVTHPHTREEFTCELVLNNVAGMRADISTWPRELLGIVEGLTSFLGLESQQIPLQMAREA